MAHIRLLFFVVGFGLTFYGAWRLGPAASIIVIGCLLVWTSIYRPDGAGKNNTQRKAMGAVRYRQDIETR